MGEYSPKTEKEIDSVKLNTFRSNSKYKIYVNWETPVFVIESMSLSLESRTKV